MNIYIFEYWNNFLGNEDLKVLAYTQEEAEELLLAEEHIREYIEDSDTKLRKVYSYKFVEEPQIL